MAKLHFKYGAMNSGKSDTLIKTAYNYQERGLPILVIKPATDTKSDSAVVARGGASRPGDEAQFLSEEQIDQLFEVAKNEGISVICYGLRTDFRTRVFPGSRRLFELADNFEKLPTMCRCGSQAEFNCRRSGETFVFEGERVAIDGEDVISYEALCGICYRRERERSRR